MKIAIKANPSRGKEIISLLESLGGITTALRGNGEIYTYYIDEYNVIRYANAPKDYKVYTLEEFETQFPFKIGDKVTIVGLPDFPKVITQMMWYCDEVLYSFEDLNNTWFDTKALKKFEMKEERNITLTLEKAKEWYKKGGELKEIALQAFTEEELTKVDLPKTWEEFYKQYEFKLILNSCLSAVNNNFSMRYVTKFEAFVKLQYLRDCWRQGNIPQQLKYKIRKVRNIYTVVYGAEDSFLSFCNQQTAEKFLECFRDLIEQAGDLI